MQKLNDENSCYFLDSLSSYADTYKDLNLNYDPKLYLIEEPFLMQAQFERLNRHIHQNTSFPRNIDYQKPAFRLPHPETKRQANHVESEYRLIIDEVYRQSILQSRDPKKLYDGNKVARQFYRHISANIDPFWTAVRENGLQSVLFRKVDVEATIEPVQNSVSHKNDSDECRKLLAEISGGERHFIIPGRSEFILGDAYRATSQLLAEKRTFNLIIVDPPWQSRSVKRKHNYETSPYEKLIDLPIEELLEDEGVLAIWITNNPRILGFVRQVLFPLHWHVASVGEAYWLKITKFGETVNDFSRPDHKLPFEVLLVARKSNCESDCKETADFTTVLSTPSVVPSRKPPVVDFLVEKFCQKQHAKVLELFARNLHPSVLSVGDEVLYMQHVEWFEVNSIG